MGTSKRRSSAGMPTIHMNAEPPVYTLNPEKTPTSRRTWGLIAINLLFLFAAIGTVVWALTRSTHPNTADLPATVVQAAEASAAPQASVGAVPSPMAVSVVESPATHPAPTAVPVQPTAPPVQSQAIVPFPSGSPEQCTPVAGLPVFAEAVCVEHDTDQDDGTLQHDNTYVVAATADDVRRFYEHELVQHGWTITNSSHDVEDAAWDYKATHGLRELKVEVETQQGPNGSFTQFRIAED